MLRGFGRPKHNKRSSALLDDLRQLVALFRRHVPSAAVRAIVVAHARPLLHLEANGIYSHGQHAMELWDSIDTEYDTDFFADLFRAESQTSAAIRFNST
jgi:hypothetical protein